MTTNQLYTLFPSAKVKFFTDNWPDAACYAELNTPERIAMFLAQTGHESAGFTRFSENLNYDATGLARTWPYRYAVSPRAKTKAPNRLAMSIARKPELIANFTYANREGNGGVETGDGWKYRGRGAIMTTFFNNYKALDEEFGMNGKVIADPDLVSTPYWAMMSAAFFWKSNNLNMFADAQDIEGARKVINGGLIGLADVQKKYTQIINLHGKEIRQAVS